MRAQKSRQYLGIAKIYGHFGIKRRLPSHSYRPKTLKLLFKSSKLGKVEFRENIIYLYGSM